MRRVTVSIMFLAGVHLLVLFGDFAAPYGPSLQHRDYPFAPPANLQFFDSHSKFHFRPFVKLGNNSYPLTFFVSGEPYKLLGVLPTKLHLFGVEAPGRIFLLGTDGFGRDQFSRLVHGGRISLSAGLLATALALFGGLIFGAVAGFYGGWVDEILMRGAELFLALPWLYLLLAIRAALPLNTGPAESFLLVIGAAGLIGWARPARLVRGVVLSAKERDYVTSARGFGASGFYLLRRHVLPETRGVLLTQAALLVPQYVLAEVTLSFLGLGVGEPTPSWGNMLAALRQYHVMASYWWMYLPALILVPLFLGYHRLASAIDDRI